MHKYGIDRKPMDRRFKKYNFQTGANSSSIEHKVRNSIILTSISITQLEKAAFYLYVRPSDAQIRHRQKGYGP